MNTKLNKVIAEAKGLVLIKINNVYVVERKVGKARHLNSLPDYTFDPALILELVKELLDRGYILDKVDDEYWWCHPNDCVSYKDRKDLGKATALAWCEMKGIIFEEV